MPSPDEEVFRIVSSLEGSARVIEAEIEVINRDIRGTEDSCKRYGEVFVAPCRFLIQLREDKKMRFREIVSKLETLQMQLESSSDLVTVLNHGR
jgi:N-glycosylase/DNA lyase